MKKSSDPFWPGMFFQDGHLMPGGSLHGINKESDK